MGMCSADLKRCRLETLYVICLVTCQFRDNNWFNEILGRQRSMVGECLIPTACGEKRNPLKRGKFPQLQIQQITVLCPERKSVRPLNLKFLPLKSRGLDENQILCMFVAHGAMVVSTDGYVHSGGIWYHNSGAWWFWLRQHDDDDNIHDDHDEDYDDGWPCCCGVG